MSTLMSAISKNILPVRMDWSTLRVVDLIEQMRMSAGTLSPTTKSRSIIRERGKTHTNEYEENKYKYQSKDNATENCYKSSKVD